MSTNPKIFSLHGKGLKLNTKADIEPHLNHIDPTLIEEIHLGGNTIGVEASKTLAEFIQKATSLKIADFADIFTGRLISEIPLALTSLCTSLIDKTSLIEINLSDNAFGGRSVDPIVPFLSSNHSFQILRLNNNGLGPTGGSVIAHALLQNALKLKKEGKESRLRTVVCGRNRLEDGSAGVWGEAFGLHAGLEEIRLPQNGIRMDGISALINGISKCPNLKILDLEDNTFGELGSGTLVKALSSYSWKQLDTLALSDCHLTDEGEVSEVCQVLGGGDGGEKLVFESIKVLRLQNNNLAEESVSLLAAGIGKSLPGLTRLDIAWNDVEEDDESVQSLIGTLKKRGGKLIINDEDEEEEEEEEEEEKEEEPPIESAADKEDEDDLADLLGKVSI